MGTASLISALLAWAAFALGISFVAAGHGFTKGCIVDDSMVANAVLTAPVGALLSIIALAMGVIGLFGPRRVRGMYLFFGIAGAAMGLIALLACFVLWQIAWAGPLPPRYLHPC
jgi:hypothetical protein